MKRVRIIVPIVVCLLFIASMLAFSGCALLKKPSTESDRKIEPYRELTDREQLLSERVQDAVMEINKIHECEAAVMLDVPVTVIIALTLEENEKLSSYSDLDYQAVYSTVCNTMGNENVIIGTENITISIGELE